MPLPGFRNCRLRHLKGRAAGQKSHRVRRLVHAARLAALEAQRRGAGGAEKSVERLGAAEVAARPITAMKGDSRPPEPAPGDSPARNPDEILFPAPFRDPADFAPIPPPQARVSDLVELAGHVLFVLFVTVVVPLAVLWAGYRLYRWLPFETMALAVVSAAALWAYRDRLVPLVQRVVFGRAP